MQSSIMRSAAPPSRTLAPTKYRAPIAARAAPAAEGRIYNFSAGPAVLPLDVLEQAQSELLNWQGSGMSVMEMSHRGKDFLSIYEQSITDLRQLMSIPDNYKVLYMQGGASTQFSAIPLNLTTPEDTIDHLVTGSWSKKAVGEAKKYVNANVATTGDNKSIPSQDSWSLSEGETFLHYCDNETIQGVEFQAPPEIPGKTLVVDMSSNILSRPVDVSKYGVLYFGAQKNIGPAGVTVVIVREDLLGSARDSCPTMLNWQVMQENDSMYNTPPCYCIYMCGLVFKKLLAEGGLEARAAANKAKADMLYDAISGSDGFYNSPVDPSVRSNMNVPFTIPGNPNLEPTFVKEAAAAGMQQLKGHRSVGGMRASIYNAMPDAGVETLVAFMKDFAAKHA